MSDMFWYNIRGDYILLYNVVGPRFLFWIPRAENIMSAGERAHIFPALEGSEEMGRKDIEEKLFEDYNDVFADIVNVLLFNGQKIVNENVM